MKNNNQQFNQLLEQYVYSMAGKFIGQVDSHTQAQLIQLYSSIHDELYAKSATSVTTPHPATHESKYPNEPIEIVQRLLASYQKSINAIQLNIQRMDLLIEQAEQSLPSTSSRDSLINHYKSIRKGFVVSLSRAQLYCQSKLFKRTAQPM